MSKIVSVYVYVCKTQIKVLGNNTYPYYVRCTLIFFYSVLFFQLKKKCWL